MEREMSEGVCVHLEGPDHRLTALQAENQRLQHLVAELLIRNQKLREHIVKLAGGAGHNFHSALAT